MHVTVLILVPACAALCDWQVHRALSGNTLSWAYVFEWPFFACYGIYVWWKLVHDQMEQTDPETSQTANRTSGLADRHEALEGATDEDEELAEYNRYLAKLNASGPPKRW